MMRLIPNFRGFDFFPHDLRLPFMRYKGLCLAASFVAMALALWVIYERGFNYGVDFTGGTVVEVQSKSGPADVAGLREQLNGLGIGAVQIQSFGNALDLFYLDVGRYPTTAEGLAALVRPNGAITGWGGPYLKGGVVPNDPWNNGYVYRSPGQAGPYDIMSGPQTRAWEVELQRAVDWFMDTFGGPEHPEERRWREWREGFKPFYDAGLSGIPGWEWEVPEREDPDFYQRHAWSSPRIQLPGCGQ